MKFLYCFLLVSLLKFTTTFAQKSLTFKGKVISLQAPVAAAKINVLNSSIDGTSNQFGEFTLSELRSGKYTIQIQAVGYSTILADILVAQNGQQKQFILKRSEQQLNEVVVSGQKQQTNLQRTPISVTSLDESTIKYAQIWTTNDIGAIVPNLYASHPGDFRTVTSIRGIVTTSYNPAVATYIDGVNQFGLDTYISQLNDVESIEVLRGPQGTLFGRNATAGVINITTKQPSNEFKGFVNLSYGNYNIQRYSAGIRGALIKNKLVFGIAGLFNKQDGFYRNEFNNASYDDQKGGQGNYYLKYQANSRLSVLFNLKHQLQLNNGAFPLRASMFESFNKPFSVDQNSITQMRDRTLNSSVSVKYDHSDFAFVSQSSYQENYRFYVDPIDGDFSANDIISVVNNYGNDFNKVKVGTQEFRLSSPTGSPSPFKWQTGAYGFIQNNPVKQGTYFGDDAGMYGSPITNFTSINTNLGSGYGFALFGQGNYPLTSNLDLIAGIRYDYEHQKQSVKGEFLPNGGNAIVTQADTSASASFKALSPKLSLNYEVSEQNYLYTSYNRGFRSGGISQLSAEPSEPPLLAFKPEYSNNFEVGSKNEFYGNRMKLNISLFYTYLNNVQVPTLVLPDAITVIKNVGKLSSKGVDVELSAILVRGLRLDYNFGLTNAEYQTLVLQEQGKLASFKGNKQIFTPKTTSFLALQYALLLDRQSNYQLTARASWKNFGDQYFDLKNTIAQNAYHLVDTRLSLQHKSSELAIWATNLTNSQYISYAYNFGAAHLGNPRTFGLTLISKF